MEVAWCSDHGLPHSHLLSWDGEDRAKLAAHLLNESARCALCGTSDWEWDEDRFAYEATEHFCPGCKMKADAAEEIGNAEGKRVMLVPKRVAIEMRERPKKSVLRR